MVDDSAMRTAIGLVLLAMTGLQLVQMRGRRGDPGGRALGATPHPVLTVLAGVVAGFATMTANAAGPVITIYLLLGGLTVLEIVGPGRGSSSPSTSAKVPFSAGLSLISRDSLQLDAILVPALLVGAVAGVRDPAHRPPAVRGGRTGSRRRGRLPAAGLVRWRQPVPGFALTTPLVCLRMVSRMKRLDSRARSSHANTQAGHDVAVVVAEAEPLAGSTKNRSQSTSPCPMSRCWCTRAVDPGGLTM